MKDLTNFYKKKTFYEEAYGPEYSKDIKRDIKRLLKNKNHLRYILLPIISLGIYLTISLPLNVPILAIIFWSTYIVGINTAHAIKWFYEDKRLRNASEINLKDLSHILLSNGVEVSIKDLEEAIIITDIKKDKVEYREVDTNKKVVNHESTIVENNFIFLDNDEKIKCLKELKEIIKMGKNREETINLYLLEEHEFDENAIEEEKVKLLKDRKLKRSN